ncbi:MAG: sugar phosphate nucleotidyltransferase, partial [Alphaproteobacteria bacterium]|nr:sugar phosphate nucleotidyltransferase [Alphaproteobacteria bacterium]
MADFIQSWFRGGYRRAKLGFAFEPDPLGTGGGLLFTLNKMRAESDEPILVLNGDSYMDLDITRFIDWYLKNDIEAALATPFREDTMRYGAVTFNQEKIVCFEEKGKAKSGYINGGIYLVKPRIFSHRSLYEKFSIEQDIFPDLAQKGLLYGFKFEGSFIDIGLPESYAFAQKMLN